MKHKKLFVVSPACFTSVNRHIYRSFLDDFKDVVLIVPSKLKFHKEIKFADPINNNDPKIYFTKLIGSNPRLQIFIGLNKAINTFEPDYILLDLDPLSFTTLLVCLNNFINNRKSKIFSITCENIPFSLKYTYTIKGISGLFSAILKNIFAKIIRKFITGVFTINNEGTSIFKELKFKNITMIPLGFDKNIFKVNYTQREDIRKKHSLDTIVISYFGRFVYEKGVHILIEALSQLKKYNWKLLLDEFKTYRTPYIEDIILQIKTNNLLDRVEFVDPTHLQMGEYLNASDIVVVPSITTKFWKEQYGRIVPEALGCGKTVITSDSGSLPLVLSGMGYIFPENNPKKLVEILQELLINNTLLIESDIISNFAHQNLSIEKQKEIMLNAFNN